jgi:hypothetical protein
MGLDKFFNLLTHPHDWSMYLAGWINDIVPGTADQCMYLVGLSRSSPVSWWR